MIADRLTACIREGDLAAGETGPARQTTGTHGRDSVMAMNEAEDTDLRVVWETTRFRARSALPGQETVQPGSELHQDDALLHPFPLSAAAQTALSVAQEHWRVLLASLAGERSEGQQVVELHINGQYSLVRGALENATRAIWLLGPDDSQTRIVRRLKLKNQEFRKAVNLRREEGQPNAGRWEERRTTLAAIAHRAQVSFGNDRVTYTDIVKDAGDRTPGLGEVGAFSAWSRCSALAHGDETAFVNLDVERLSSEDGVTQARVTGSAATLARYLWAAARLFDQGIELFHQRARTA